MPALESYLPTKQEALETIDPSEVGWAILNYVNENGRDGKFVLFNAICHFQRENELLARVIAEGTSWLLANKLFCEYPSNGASTYHFRLTRQAERISNRAGFDSMKKAALLPTELLHPSIREDVSLHFARAKYSTAVFEAFRAVEIAVRTAAGLEPTDVGVALMRKAFHKDKGQLSDMAAPDAERQSLSELFAGAIGSYKNPHSHRKVEIEAEEAVEMVVLASHLLKIVDSRLSAIKRGKVREAPEEG